MRRARFRRDHPKSLAVDRRHRIDLLPYAFIAPISLLLLAINLYPSLYAIRLTVTDASLLRLARAKFIGLWNLVRMAGDPVFEQGLWRTLRWDLTVVLTQLAIARPIALFLNLKLRGRGVVRTAAVVPYIVPLAVTALLWAYRFELVRYLHLNPLRTQVVPDLRHLDRYPWTGHSVLLGTVPRPWQATQAVLGHPGRPLAPVLGVQPAAIPKAARRGAKQAPVWRRLLAETQ